MGPSTWQSALLTWLELLAVLAKPKPSSTRARKAFTWSAALSSAAAWESSMGRTFKQRRGLSIELQFCTYFLRDGRERIPSSQME